MSIEWVLYWIDIAGSLANFCRVIFVLLFIVASILSVVCFSAKCDKEENVYRACLWYVKLIAAILIPISIIFTFVPSQKTMYAIAFARYSKQSDIPEKVLKAIEVKLDEVIEGAKK